MSNLYKNKAKVFCDTCGVLSLNSIDHRSKMLVGVCRSCELTFFQPNRKKWEAGWRPSKDEIKKFKIQNEKSVYSILNEIDNYI